MTSGLLFWLIFMFVFLLVPVGYGSGYRGWGPPLPRYFQHHRVDAANAEAWGLGGDFVWGILFIGACWALAAVIWR